MTSAAKIAAIVNPNSASGRTAHRWPALAREVERHIGDFATFQTQYAGHATELVRKALREGYDRIISVGGDGTHHEVVNGFFDGLLPVNPRAVMAILPLGTGSDLARTLKISNTEAMIPHLTSENTLLADVGRVTFSTEGNGQRIMHFINTCHIGMGGAVAARVNRTTKRYGGFTAYLWGVLATLATYRNPFLQIDIDGQQIDQVTRDLIIANGQYDGAGMYVAPQARLDSGRFEVLLIENIGRIQSMLNIPLLYKGRLAEKTDCVRTLSANRIAVRSNETVYVNLDGEQPGQLPAVVEVVPKALRLVVPAASIK